MRSAWVQLVIGSARGQTRLQWQARVREAASLLTLEIERLERCPAEVRQTFACQLAVASLRQRLERLCLQYGALLD
jgi:hypothetical protein